MTWVRDGPGQSIRFSGCEALISQARVEYVRRTRSESRRTLWLRMLSNTGLLNSRRKVITILVIRSVEPLHKITSENIARTQSGALVRFRNRRWITTIHDIPVGNLFVGNVLHGMNSACVCEIRLIAAFYFNKLG